jgi:glyoxylase-like metal-dependent hydrolase (beta-lactamase superfamily II)
MIDSTHGGNLKQYLASLDRVIALDPARLLPAHGSEPANPSAVLKQHVKHRLMREAQVLESWAEGRRTVESIADYIYDGLNPALMAAARKNVRAHLEKLVAEGRVPGDVLGSSPIEN